MSDVPTVIILESDSDSPSTSPAIVADSQIPSSTHSSDSGASSSGASGHGPDPVIISDGHEDPPEIPAPLIPGPSEPQHHSGGVVIPGEYGDVPFRNEHNHWARRLPDGRVVLIPPFRYRIMTTGRAEPPPAVFDDSSSDDSSSDDSSDEDSDEDPEEAPVQPPSTPPKKRYRFNGTVIPGVNGGRSSVNAHGLRTRVTARKRVVPYPADPFVRKAYHYAPSTSGAGTSASPVPSAPPAPPVSPSVEELTREVEILRARVTELEDQMSHVMDILYPPSP
ncbi:uncharacterized protein [Rutidosis leptorrhynchoides]|uniref:uncharacterized protein n=1 Tax=Rutidosis leptorrhynchoides TaxID=125765 RepID=UPI003A98D272